jgi:hypothetical protein
MYRICKTDLRVEHHGKSTQNGLGRSVFGEFIEMSVPCECVLILRSCILVPTMVAFFVGVSLLGHVSVYMYIYIVCLFVFNMHAFA